MNYNDIYIQNKMDYIYMKNYYGGSNTITNTNITNTNTIYVDEKQYVARNYDNLDGIELLTGPIFHTIIHNTKYNKKIHLFGDKHVYTNRFSCNGKDTSANSIYFPDYLEYYFTKGINKDINKGNNNGKIIDLFIELSYSYDKKISFLQSGIIDNVFLRFKSCFESLMDKSLCKNKYPNIRFHAMDIRDYISDDFSKEQEISLFNYFSQRINNMLGDVKKIHSGVSAKIDTLIQDFLSYDEFMLSDKLNEIAEEYYSSDDYSLNTIRDLSLLITNNANNNYDQLKKQMNTIMNDIIEENDAYVEMDEFTILMIERYIGDENGIYTDMDNRFWYLCSLSTKLNNNMNEVVGNNFEPNINVHYINYRLSDDDEIFKDMFKSNKITLRSLSIISRIIWGYDLALMDVYMLGRIFKQFKHKSQDDIFSESADNIIIIAGNKHIKSYIDFFTKIGSEVIYQSQPLVEPIKNRDRCVPMVKLEF